MSNLILDTKKAVNKYKPVMERLGVTSPELQTVVAEIAEIQATFKPMNENGAAYANGTNTPGMGSFVAPGFSGTPGTMGTAGSDFASSLVPVAMKIAAHTIGLELVTTKSSTGPVIDLGFLDFPYDNTPVTATDERPSYFKVTGTSIAAIRTFINTQLTTAGITKTISGLSGRIWFHVSTSTSNDLDAAYSTTAPSQLSTSKAGWLEFLGFSRVDNLPMFKAYNQVNTASSGGWTFNASKNTFDNTTDLTTFFNSARLEDPADGIYTNGTDFGTVTTGDVSLISSIEDDLLGFTSQGAAGPMDRLVDDQNPADSIGTSFFVKRINVGTDKVKFTLQNTTIEDIKAQTGIDILEKGKAVLVNKMSQKISQVIVNKIKELAARNRANAPASSAGTISNQTIFDFDVTYYLSTNAPGGETSHAVAAKLVNKIRNGSNYIMREGRIGGAQYVVTNSTLASTMAAISSYSIVGVDAKMPEGQLYPYGTILNGIKVYVDPHMLDTDLSIYLGRKNSADQPGILFIPFLMAQEVTVISEATFAPSMLLRSRYTVAEVGFLPEKQFLEIKVKDTNNVLA